MYKTKEIEAIARTWDGSYEQKERFHKIAKAFLRMVGKELGVPFAVRSNKGGPAVLGDAILHSDNLYINLGGSCWDDYFMYRTVKGQKDYTGDTNNWMSYSELAHDPERAIKRFKNPIP
jgi:hypothetical protein